jgi:galactokinase/mevalonate kinase-like predicted kinase
VLVDAATMDVVDGVEVPQVHEIASPPMEAQLVVAWRSSTASSSDDYHAPLRREPAALAAPMAELAALASGAAAALAAGDLRTLGDAIDETWRIRQAAAPLRSDHAALVELARATGLPATTPGSGGSVVVLAAHGDVEEAVAALVACGCEVVTTLLA